MLGVAIGAPAPTSAGRIERFSGMLAVGLDLSPAMTVSGDTLGAFSDVGLDSHHFPVAAQELQVQNVAGSLFDGAGVLPLRGVYKVCLYSACGTSAVILRAPETQRGVRGVGIGGSLATRPDDFIWFTVTNGPATTIPTFGGDSLVRAGTVFAPGGGSDFSSAAQDDGRIRMVSPFSIRLPDHARVFQGAPTRSAHFAPEPGTLTLLGAGIVVLLSRARRRS